MSIDITTLRPRLEAALGEQLQLGAFLDGLLTPSQVRRRRWKRRALYLGIVVVSAGPVIYFGARIGLRMMSFFVSGGEGADPALIASGGAVPDSIVRLAREEGSVRASEHVELVFIQANHTFADALLMTDSAIIRRGFRKAPFGARSRRVTSTSSPSNAVVRQEDSSS